VSMSPPPASVWHTTVRSLLGDLTLIRDRDGLRGLRFGPTSRQPDAACLGPASDRGFTAIDRQLRQYLAGDRHDFDFALSVSVTGDQLDRDIWERTRQIPYGDVATYDELAARIGAGTTARRVGEALIRNPLPIVSPCLRRGYRASDGCPIRSGRRPAGRR
jgi:methylated-DNA-[protein]-cysteine S-methyltransferase